MNQLTNPLAASANPSTPPPPPVLWAMLTHSGDYWQVGLSIPTTVPLQMVGLNPKSPQPQPPTHADLTVMKLVRFENGDVYAFAFPRENTELDQIKTGAIFKISSMAVKMTSSFARFDVLRSLMDEAEERAEIERESMLDDGGDDPDDEPEEPEEPEAAAQPAQPQAPQQSVPLPPPAPLVVQPQTAPNGMPFPMQPPQSQTPTG